MSRDRVELIRPIRTTQHAVIICLPTGRAARGLVVYVTAVDTADAAFLSSIMVDACLSPPPPLSPPPTRPFRGSSTPRKSRATQPSRNSPLAGPAQHRSYRAETETSAACGDGTIASAPNGKRDGPVLQRLLFVSVNEEFRDRAASQTICLVFTKIDSVII